MNLNKFASIVTKEEGLKKSITVAQVKEVLKIVNKKTFGILYAIVRLLSVLIITSFYSYAQAPYNYWTADNGTNPTNQIADAQGVYNLNYSAYSPGSVHISNVNPKVGNYIQIRSDNNIIQASSSTFPLTSSFAIEFILRTTRDWAGGEFLKDGGGAFNISFEIPNNGYVRPSITFATTTGGTYDELVLRLDGIGRKNYGWYADGNWHHFVFQYNATTGLKEIWIDGERPTSDFYKNTTPGNITRSNTALGMVLNSNTPYRKVNCDLDEIAVYKTTLSPQLIQQHILNINAGQHYANFTSISSPAPVSPTTTPIDTMEYAVGFLNQTVTYQSSSITATRQPNNTPTKQLQTFPLPRYKTGHTLPPLFNWCDLTYMAGKGQTLPAVTSPVLFTPINTSQYLQNITDILHETTYNWNTAIASPEVGRTNEYITSSSPLVFNNNTANGRIAKFANDSTQYHNTLITLKAQISGCLECSKTLANNYYLQNGSGQFLDGNGNVTSNVNDKILRPSNNPSDFTQDGQTMKSMVQAYVSVLSNRPATNKINEINENGEILLWLQDAVMALDPVVVADKNASGMSWQDYQGQRFYELEKTSYRDIIFSINGLQNSKFSQYQLDGFPEYKFKWNKVRQLPTYTYNNQKLSTGDLYPRHPYGWRNITGAWNGIRHFTKARQAEIAAGDTMFRPFINAGFEYDETSTVRPAQYLGMLKIMTGLGAISFYNGYFTVSQPFQIPANWIWQAAIPSYAQALLSKVESIYKSSYLLPGDGTWNPDDAASGVSYLYNAGDFRKVVAVRKWTGGNKYLIFTAFMNNTNMTDTSTYEGVATINFDGITNLSLKTRRQGSVYMFDNTVTPPVFVQLDGWHERTHPERWSQDIIIEGELADNGVFQIKTEGAVARNFTNAVSYATVSGAQTLSYNIQRPENSPAIRYFWIRARSNNGTATSASIALNGGSLKKIDCITNTSWQWYRVENSTSAPISFSLPAKGRCNISVLSGNSSLEIDKIAMIVSSADVYNATTTNCGGTATITPSGATTFCNGDSVILVASAGSAYLWSTGSTNDSITVKTSGTYTVTVTVGGTPVIASPVTVTVVSLPISVITAGSSTSICSGNSVILSANMGAGLSYQWQKNGANIPFENNINYSASSAGSYTCVVTNATGCVNTSNSISVTTLTAPTALITPSGATTFCQGGSVQLSASSNSAYMWNNGATTQSITASSSGTFSVTVIGSNGCKATSSPITVSVTAAPTAFISVPTSIICTGSTAVITAQTGSGYSYQWQANSVNIAGATSNTYNASVGAAYRCVVTANGCSATSNIVNIIIVPAPSTANAGADQNICVDSCILAANAVVNGTGQWTRISGTGNIANIYQYNTKVTNIASGTSVFRWTITNAPCTPSFDEVSITRSASNPASVSIVASPNPYCNGTVVNFTATPVNGGIATYQWKKNNVNVGSSIPSYSGVFNDNDSVWVIMTSSLSCASGSPATSNKIYLDSSAVSATITNSTPLTFCNGDSTLLYTNSSLGYSYQWYNDLGVILLATDTAYKAKVSGTYKVVITNAQGCSATSNSITVTVNALPSVVVTPNGSTSFCAGGSVLLSATSNTSYLWSTGATTQSITASSAGSYTVTVTDANGCSSVSSPLVVTNASLPVATITPNTPTVICDGQTQVFSANTGVGLSYIWYRNGINTGVNTRTFTADTDGDYYVIVSNDSFCVKSSDTVSLSVTTPVSATITNSRPLTFCGNDSTILTANAGASYLWNNGATTQSITVKTLGSYAVTVTSGGCASTSSPVTVNAYPPFNLCQYTTNQVANQAYICGNAPGQLIATINPIAGASYLWNTGATTQSIDITAEGSYSYIVTNSVGCKCGNSFPVIDTCNNNNACRTPYSLFTDQNKRLFLCFDSHCSYARANWSQSTNANVDYHTLYYKNLKTGHTIAVRKLGSMRRAYMYNLQSKTNYQWWVTATCDGVETDISEVINFKTK